MFSRVKQNETFPPEWATLILTVLTWELNTEGATYKVKVH